MNAVNHSLVLLFIGTQPSGLVTVELDGEVVEVECDQLVPARPHHRNEAVMVIFGPFCGLEGTLLAIDVLEGIVKTSDESVTMMPLKYLCRCKKVDTEGINLSDLLFSPEMSTRK